MAESQTIGRGPSYSFFSACGTILKDNANW
jgi:hypothetical protein